MAKTGYGNFDYTCSAYWRGQPHNFSITGNHSGSSFTASDAETFMTGAASPYAMTFCHFQSSGINVVEAKYYDGKASAPVWEAVYNTDAPPPSPITGGTGTAYTTVGGADYLPIEVCVNLECQVGFNSKSKPIYVRKFLRGIPTTAISNDSHGEVTWDFAANAAAAVAAMGNGDWYGNRVYISPSGRQGTAEGWTHLTYPGNHQVPRGKKRNTSSGSSSNVLSLAEQLLASAAGSGVARVIAGAG